MDPLRQDSRAHEVAAVDDLLPGDVISVNHRMWKIEAIEEHPATRCLLLTNESTQFIPWATYKRRRTLVYREVK